MELLALAGIWLEAARNCSSPDLFAGNFNTCVVFCTTAMLLHCLGGIYAWQI